LDEIEWKEYQPFKHQSGGFASATVYDYDEETIQIEVKSGIEGQGNESVVYTEGFELNREEILLTL
jgi:hypothetical protein